MNKLIQNLAQLADAAEYFDRKTGAAWKIRSCLTNMAVWACNGLLYAQRSDSAERMVSAMVQVATLRCWVRDSNTNSFTLDLTYAAVAKTLGLERVVDVHEEAKRMARMKCIQTRSAQNFGKFYKASLDAFEEQKRQRQENVEAIVELLSDTSFTFDMDQAEAADMRNIGNFAPGEQVNDADLYDDTSVERQADQLAETVGNALEAMHGVCEAELAAAITADKVSRLTGYMRAIENMFSITGVDVKRLVERRAKLDAMIDAEAEAFDSEVKKLDAQIAEQLAKEAEPLVEKPKMKRVKKADSLKKLGELVA